MSSQQINAPLDFVPAKKICSTCPALCLKACSSSAVTLKPTGLAENIPQKPAFALARRAIHQAGSGMIPVICDGWAAAYVTLQSGERQILWFVLPGEFVSATQVLGFSNEVRIEAITDVRFRMFDQPALTEAALSGRRTVDCISAAWLREKQWFERMIVDIGRRTAEQRIARLISSLVARLKSRGMVKSYRRIPFPLRHHHIADAAGLSPPSVSTQMAEFRRKGILSIDDRFLSILDLANLERVAGEPITVAQ